MNEIYARRIITEQGEEIIEIDLNKPWPRHRTGSYPSYKDEIERLMLRKQRQGRRGKEFITVLH